MCTRVKQTLSADVNLLIHQIRRFGNRKCQDKQHSESEIEYLAAADPPTAALLIRARHRYEVLNRIRCDWRNVIWLMESPPTDLPY